MRVQSVGLLLFLAAATCALASWDAEDDDKEWWDYKQQFRRSYDRIENELRHRLYLKAKLEFEKKSKNGTDKEWKKHWNGEQDRYPSESEQNFRMSCVHWTEFESKLHKEHEKAWKSKNPVSLEEFNKLCDGSRVAYRFEKSKGKGSQ